MFRKKTPDVVLVAVVIALPLLAPAPQPPLDPAAWGRDHVGARLPDYVPGDECLFCHRNTIGPNWKETSHGASTRQLEDAPIVDKAIRAEPRLAAIAKDTASVLGSRHRVRLLAPNGFGKFKIADVQGVATRDGVIERWMNVESTAWDGNTFGDRCAGCHATAVESESKTFAAFGIDCYSCHGDVTLEHTKNTALIWWSQKRRNDTSFDQVQAMMSICAQCHLRGGASKSTGLPYATHFIAGDNLFRDFNVDFARADDQTLNAGDRHVWRNVRDVVVGGAASPACITCHRVHTGKSDRHRALDRSPICLDCHAFDGAKVTTLGYAVSSALCEYEGVASKR